MREFFLKTLLLIIAAALIIAMTSCSTDKTAETSQPEQTGDVSREEVSVDIKDDEIIMSNKRLKVEISKPGIGYRAKRFDWAGVVKQVTLDEKYTYLSTEKPNYQYDPNLGFGLIGQFEPAFSRMYEGEYVISSDENSVIFEKNVPKDDKGRGYRLTKAVTLEDNRLHIKCSLENLGDKALTFGEYNHNFMIINREPVCDDYELKFSFTPELKLSPLTGKNLFSLEGDTLTWTKKLTEREEFLCQLTGFEKGKKDYYWQLIHKPSGAGVKALTDFEIVKIQLWGKNHTICPEVFLQEKIEPGQIFEWTRTYEFFAT